MTGEDDLPKVGKLVAVDWPQGKKGHLEVTGLPENVQVPDKPLSGTPRTPTLTPLFHGNPPTTHWLW